MEENTEIPDASKELISSKINLLKTDLQPIFTKIRTGLGKEDWDKYWLKLYVQQPSTKSLKTIQNNKIIALVILVAGTFLASKFATPIEHFSTFLLEKINQLDSTLVNDLLTENGENKLGEQAKTIATVMISVVPVSALIYAYLHIRHIGTTRKEMIDHKNDSFNLGLFKSHNPEIFQLAESFSKDGFVIDQFESYIRSDDDREKQRKTIEMITDMQQDLKKFEADALNLTNDTNALNELLDTFQRNFNRLSNVVLHQDVRNFEFSLSFLSKKFVLYRFRRGNQNAQKIIDSGDVGTDRLLEIKANKHQPFIDLYLKDKHSCKDDKTVSYLVRLNEDETWVITYYLDTDTNLKVKFLIGDGKIGEGKEEDSIFLSRELYEIVRKHLLVIHHIDSIMNSVGEEL
ncbi:hypothetical protein [Peribacillus muralis]|uniref:hypothetical protein n=1 Tax=Peribacillus muralis TaxID=264697 RepID=UPI0036723A91